VVRICPHCQQPINDEDALLCHFCGESLQRSLPGIWGSIISGPGKWVLALIAILVIVSFLAAVM